MNIIRATHGFAIMIMLLATEASQAQLKPPALRLDSTTTGTIKKELSQDLSPITGYGKNLYQQLDSKIKIFDGGKFITNPRLDTRLEYTWLHDTSAAAIGINGGRQSLVAVNLTYSASFAHLPFTISFKGNNGNYLLSRNSLNDFSALGFDQKKYLEDIRQQVIKKVSPDAVTSSVTSRIDAIRRTYERDLQNEIADLQREYTTLHGSTLRLPAGITDLSATDMASLSNRLLTDTALSKYRQSLEGMQELQKTKEPTALKKDSVYRQLAAGAGRYEALQKIYGRILASKSKFDNNKMVAELRSNLSFNKGAYQDYLRNPQNLEKLIDQQVSLTALQRLFVNMTHLDIGQTALQSGDFSTNNIVQKGVNTEYKNKTANIGFVYGKSSNTNNWLQSGLTSAVTNEYSSMTGFKLGTGTSAPVQQSITLNLFDYNNQPGPVNPANPSLSAYLPSARRKDAAISWHSTFTIAGKHNLALDLSKSFGAYTDNSNADSGTYKTNAHGDLFKNTGISNFAGAIDYTGEIYNTDLRIFIKKVGLGYNNPGNAYLRRGETQLGAGFARKFYRKKITVKYNVDYRAQNFDPAKNYRYTALSNKLQLGYRINRDSRIALTWQNMDNKTDFFGQPSSPGNNSRLQLDGGYRFTVMGKKIINNVSVGRQQMNMPILAAGEYKSTNWLFTHTSSLALDKNILSLTFLANKSDNKGYYFNTSMVNIETGYSYVLANNIRLGSTAGYYDNTGWNRQLGIRQQISATLMDKMMIELDLNYRKAIQITRTDLANQVFLSALFHYTF